MGAARRVVTAGVILAALTARAGGSNDSAGTTTQATEPATTAVEVVELVRA